MARVVLSEVACEMARMASGCVSTSAHCCRHAGLSESNNTRTVRQKEQVQDGGKRCVELIYSSVVQDMVGTRRPLNLHNTRIKHGESRPSTC